MRGKRFLDIKIAPVVAKPASSESTVVSPEAPIRNASPARSVGSIWSTKRLFASASGAPLPSSGSNGSSPSPGAGSNSAGGMREVDPVAQLVATKKKFLFVQDPKTLILVSCDKNDAKNSFKVLVAVPLLYCGRFTVSHHM
jgi:hypothetical protein